jgi:hypothetical protein
MHAAVVVLAWGHILTIHQIRIRDGCIPVAAVSYGTSCCSMSEVTRDTLLTPLAVAHCNVRQTSDMFSNTDCYTNFA